MKLKKLIAVILAATLAGCSSSSGTPGQEIPDVDLDDAQPVVDTAPPADTLEAMHETMKDSNALLGTLFMGFAENWTYESAINVLSENVFSESFPFLKELPESQFVNAGGYMLYLLVPQENAEMTVSRVDADLNITEELFRKNDGQPVLLVCNEEDEADIVTEITLDGQTVTFYPLVGNDFRSVLLPNGGGVLDYSTTAYYSDAGMENSLDAMRSELQSQESMLGIAFIGYLDEINAENVKALLENDILSSFYPFVYNIDSSHMVNAGGPELYLLVPYSEGSTISVNLMNEKFEVTDVLHRDETGSPLLVMCNPDGRINTQVIVTEGDKSAMFFPMLDPSTGLVYFPDDREVAVTDYTFGSGGDISLFAREACYDRLMQYLNDPEIEYFNETVMIDGNICLIFEQGSYEGEAFVASKKYAVSQDALKIYAFDEDTGGYSLLDETE